jgi:serine/threonine-protein kinase RsbW
MNRCLENSESDEGNIQGGEMVRMIDDQTVEVSLPNRLGYERIAMECTASFARIVGLLRDRIDDLKTAVSEACLNAIEHGNQGRPEARVVITLHYTGNAFTVTVLDEGEGGVPELFEEPDIEKKIANLEAPRGLGLFLMKNLVDQIEFNHETAGGHSVRMVLRMGERGS